MIKEVNVWASGANVDVSQGIAASMMYDGSPTDRSHPTVVRRVTVRNHGVWTPDPTVLSVSPGVVTVALYYPFVLADPNGPIAGKTIAWFITTTGSVFNFLMAGDGVAFNLIGARIMAVEPYALVPPTSVHLTFGYDGYNDQP